MPAAISLRMQRRGVRRDPVAPGGGAAHRDLALDLHQVLDRDRNAVQRADGVAGADGLVRGLGGEPGIGGVDRDEGVQPGFQPLDAGKVFVHEVDRRQAARGDLRGQRVDGTEGGGGHGVLPCGRRGDHAAARRAATAPFRPPISGLSLAASHGSL